MKRFTPFLLLLLSMVSCTDADPNKQVDEGDVKGTIYESREVGWLIQIPAGWKITSRDKVEANEEKGKTMIEKSTGIDVDAKALKHLISFQKDQFNVFASTSEPFTEEFPGAYEQQNRKVNEIIFNTLKDQGIRADTASGKEMIQGLEFSTFYTTIYAPDGNIILRQILYSRLINGYDFAVNINYNNEKDKKTMTGAFENSNFTGK